MVIRSDLGNLSSTCATDERGADNKREDPSHEPTILAPMGFDPNRKHVPRKSDIWFVAAGLTVAVLLVIWALLG